MYKHTCQDIPESRTFTNSGMHTHVFHSHTCICMLHVCTYMHTQSPDEYHGSVLICYKTEAVFLTLNSIPCRGTNRFQ